MSEFIETITDRVATLTMNRPERRNAMSAEIMAGLEEALPRLAQDPEVGAIVLTGAGPAFCAGGDVKSMAAGKGDQSLEQRVTRLRNGMEVSRLLHEIPKPTIAMVRGAAAGAGLSMALACDMRFVSDNAKFTTAFANVGFSGDYGGSYFLTHLVGSGKARELYYSADLILAEEAERIGMVNRIIADDQLEAETQAFAARLAAGPSIALGYMKKNMNAAETRPLAECFDMEAMHHSRTGQTEDHKEASKAFVEKRKPVFSGR
jgi:2-(1,2-epoxy-1,2-dihydrophenyl)acetyl-CoA isomerase